MKKFTFALLCVIFLLSATLGFVACTEEHKHTFTEEKAEPQYLASEATCTEPAQYYYSCSCGEKGTETFASGNALGHSFTNYVSDGNATCTADGTKTAKCDRCDETDIIADVGSKLPHTFDKQVATEQYLASAATCTQAATYYYSCTCGEKGTETFASGNALGHSYSADWSHDQTEHWHAATCGHDVEKDCAAHTFDDNKKCTECGYVTTKPLGLEMQSSVFDINLATKTAYLKVANAVTDYDFSDKFAVADGARFDVCTDKQCNNKITSKRTNLIVGNNVFYILVTNGNDVVSYAVTLRRRPIYTVTFNANGGTAVETQQVEEDSFATAPTTTRKGYEFIAWDYDFSSPVLQEEVVTASWQVIVYNISYELNGGKNVEKNPITYTVEDEDIILAAPTKLGHIGSWSEGDKIPKGSTGNKTFTAVYTPDVYLSNDGSTVTGLRNTSIKDLVILSEYNGIPVSRIGDGAFQNRSGLTSITIPNSVTLIGDSAFSGCSGLTSITIPNSVTSIGDSAFWGCSGLTSITIGSSVTSIGDFAFYNCSGLTSITIPNSVTSIGDFAFSGCSGLTSIEVAEGNIKYHSRGNCIIETKNKTLILGCKTSVIPVDGSVTSIGSYAFSGCSGLTSITIPNSVTLISYSAFEGCNGLTSITIPNSVTSIGSAAFEDCSGLTSIEVTAGNTKYHSQGNCIIETASKTLILGCKNSVIPVDGSVTSIGSYAFSGCSGLTSITIPNSVTLISYSAFWGCSGLTSITIPNSVTSIGDSAFWGCSRLTSVTIPNSVTSIGDYAFYNCQGLTSINYTGTIAQWNAISRGNNWNYHTGKCTIHCTDGDIAK